jgi:hypothetical protein
VSAERESAVVTALADGLVVRGLTAEGALVLS